MPVQPTPIQAHASSAGPADISCQEITKFYPGATTPAVERVSIHILPGKVTVLLGPSGCGKTTLIKMINRLIEPTSGKIYINEVEIHDLPATRLRRQIGYVIQQVGLFPHMTVAQNIAVAPRLEGWDRKAIQDRIEFLLDMVNLPAAYARRYPRHLSGGEQQRVGLARALAADPGTLLMDEPFGALDAISRENLQDQMIQIQRRVGKTILFVTHDVEEALKLGDQIAVMREGQLAQVGSPLEMISRPNDAFVAQLMGAETLEHRLRLLTAADVLALKNSGLERPGVPGRPNHRTARLDDDLRKILALMLENGAESIQIVDAAGVEAGRIGLDDLRGVLE